MADEINYRIYGADTQFVQIELDQEESAIAEAGALMYMDYGIEMKTIMGDGSKSGMVGSLVKGAKRAISGEGFFMTSFQNKIGGRKQVSFSAPHPGKIIPLDLKDLGGTVLCQRDAFLCAARGVSLSIAFQKRIMAGFFGGEGFILQKLSGNGMAFVHAGGASLVRELQPNETVYVDTGCVVALQTSVDFDIHVVKGVTSLMFGGEGAFLAKLTGPGKVWLQSMPFSNLSAAIIHRFASGKK